ncbi:variant erythrocyte surface antigen beta subunit, putative [Babesia ovis]|uniref:Variant erythrocyte surface antigen beta subunit, putative n=1 Tax=Babesia ovis TaxID=5869 RepID=A0A9W5TDR4_BABOV|nr:variant erythrocyte surface antigen beta subunit, putative [Babesia ovis]
MSAPATGGTGKTLKDSPTNLKEAIDWILRLTGKDGLPAEAYKTLLDCLCLLSEVVHDLVRDVEGYLDEEELGVVRGTLRDLQGVEGTRRISELVEGVSNGLQGFVGWTGSGNLDGKSGIASKDYKTSYDKGSNDCKWDEIYDSCTGSGTSGTGSGTSGTDRSGTSGTLETLARILLGAIPLVFSGLSYLYYTFGDHYLCDNQKGLANGSDTLVGQYMQRMGYQIDELVELKLGSWDRSKNQMTDTGNVFSEVFGRCGILGDGSPSARYADYLHSLRGKAKAGKDSKDTKHSLIILNTICSGYFRSLHTIDSIRDPRPRTPNTIREILYWLTSLPYCPIYRTLVPKVQEMIRRIGSKEGSDGKGEVEVVFYGSNWKGESRELKVSDGNCASYLLGAALVAPLVLLGIQDTIDCLVGKEPVVSRPGGNESYKLENYKNDVAIHDLYANMQFQFTYPLSETQSYYVLQDCLVALYYQLYFLRLQCESGYTQGYGWGWCKYGDGVKCDDGGVNGTGCLSWICPVGDKESHGYGNGKDGSSNQCGNGNGKASPLQAFLTDCLKGFTCPVVMDNKDCQENLDKLRNKSSTDYSSVYSKCYPEFLSHRGHTTVPGTECAVPMGFSGSFRKDGPASKPQPPAAAGHSMIGLGINAVLAYYATSNMSMSGLYQITRCICSLTRRVPRSTGTLYGFFYGLGLVYISKRTGGQTPFKDALKDEMLRCPGWRKPECLMEALMGWTETDHSEKHTNEYKGKPAKATLGSLHACDNKTENGHTPTCGEYLRPLTGYLYNSLATQFCETYVSWIVHLTWRLHSGLKSLLKEFRNINCKEAGCKGAKGGGTCQCKENGCKPSTHGVKSDTNADGCCCDNVVECVGVHGLFYRFGFSYRDPKYLGGKDSDGAQWKKTCKDFNTQLNNVINGDLFKKLFDAINDFMYTTRALFGVYIGVYWTAVIVYLLWSMTVNLDLIHIQSHWRSPGSYLVPLQRILADGSRKGFCTLGYFQEANGDRLLSLGVSDVYL